MKHKFNRTKSGKFTFALPFTGVFVYVKDGYKYTSRIIDITKVDDSYIEGFENGKYKKFLKDKIVGKIQKLDLKNIVRKLDLKDIHK